MFLRIGEVLPFGLSPTSGVVGSLIELSRVLVDAGHDVDLWIPGTYPRDGDGALDELRARGVGVELVPGTSRRAAASAMVDRIGVSGCDVLHIHNGFSLMNNLIVRSVNMPYVVTTHGVYSTESLAHHSLRKAAFIRTMERPMLQKAAAVTALTPVEAVEVSQVAPGVEADVIPLGFNRWSGEIDRTLLRNELGVSPHKLITLFGGRFDVYMKRLDHLVRGVAEADDWHLVLLGADFRDGRAALEAEIVRLGIEHRCHILDLRTGDRLRDSFAGADLIALPSRWEGLPRGLIEPMLLGVPAMVSDEVERRVPVKSTGAGWITRPDEIGQTLTAIREAPATQRRAAGDQAKVLAETYLWDAVEPSWLAMFERARGH